MAAGLAVVSYGFRTRALDSATGRSEREIGRNQRRPLVAQLA
jgi:hypothetical protein